MTEATMTKPVHIQRERVVDGWLHSDVVMVTPPVVTPGCVEERHCAAHGDEPFTCCKCGAAFRFATDEERRVVTSHAVALRDGDGNECFRVFVTIGDTQLITTPQFQSMGAARAYADMLLRGDRRPELRQPASFKAPAIGGSGLWVRQ